MTMQHEEHYRFGPVDAFLDHLKAKEIINNWSDGFYDEGEDEEQLPFEDMTDSDVFSCQLPFAITNSTLLANYYAMLMEIPKHLMLKILEIPKEELPRQIALVPSCGKSTGEHLAVPVRALIRRGSECIPTWDTEPRHRKLFLKVIESLLIEVLHGSFLKEDSSQGS